MSGLQEQAEIQTDESRSFMQEMEMMRKKAQPYFSADFNPDQVWEEAMDDRL